MPAGIDIILGVSLRTIVLSIVGAFAVLMFVLFPLTIFAVAMLEPYRVRPLTPVADAQASPPSGANVIEQAMAEGFAPLGRFKVEDSGWTKGSAALLLSPDARSLLWVQHSRAGARHRLMTPLEQGRWLVTTKIIGVVDMTGLLDEIMLPDSAFEVLLFYHKQRLASLAGPSQAVLDPQDVLDRLFQLDRGRADKLVELGLARFTDVQQTDFHLTLRGAIRITAGYFTTLRGLKQQKELTDQKTLEYQASRQYAQQMASVPPAAPQT